MFDFCGNNYGNHIIFALKKGNITPVLNIYKFVFEMKIIPFFFVRVILPFYQQTCISTLSIMTHPCQATQKRVMCHKK